ncbi:unnamed protein product [Chrysoparadoxa australica]
MASMMLAVTSLLLWASASAAPCSNVNLSVDMAPTPILAGTFTLAGTDAEGFPIYINDIGNPTAAITYWTDTRRRHLSEASAAGELTVTFNAGSDSIMASQTGACAQTEDIGFWMLSKAQFVPVDGGVIIGLEEPLYGGEDLVPPICHDDPSDMTAWTQFACLELDQPLADCPRVEPEEPFVLECGLGDEAAVPAPGQEEAPPAGSFSGITAFETESDSEFTITVVNVNSDPKYNSFFQDAALRWQDIIVGDLEAIPAASAPSVGWLGPAGRFDATPWGGEAYLEDVDDIVIGFSITEIDGVGAILGQAGPYAMRSGGSQLPLSGRMEFDIADFEALIAAEQAGDVIMHEMGHVLGFGSLWPTRNGCGECGIGINFLYENPGQVCEAQVQYEALNFPGSLRMEDNGQANDGSHCSHWDEELIGSELMSPSLNPGVPNPLTAISIGAMADLGYTVSYVTAQAPSGPTAPIPEAAFDSNPEAAALKNKNNGTSKTKISAVQKLRVRLEIRQAHPEPPPHP